jgi:hypothetical protein
MDTDTRAELREGVETLVRAAGGQSRRHGRCTVLMSRHGEVGVGQVWQSVYLKLDGEDDPPLTPAQQLALSVLLEDEAVFPQVLADYLLDAGHDYTLAVAARAADEARADERRKCAVALQHAAEDVRRSAETAPGDTVWWNFDDVVQLIESARTEMESPAP